MPWNLKYNKKNKKFTAYDWEDSIDSFLPFYDLIFYKLTVKKLLNKRVEINKEKYLNALNLRGLHDRYVKDIYLISKILFLIKSKI